MNDEVRLDNIIEFAQAQKQSDPPAACFELSIQESILSVLDQELKQNGFRGSTQIPRLVFLAFYTRIFDKPVSLIIKGPSGSGKSFALLAGKQFIPSSAYEEFHGMSERALLYMKGLNLKHKYLIIQEAAGLNTGIGRVFLRQLLSEGQINYATVQNTNDGLVGKKLPPVEGPTGAMMTTTANELHLEDETRFISVHMDESPERIREALLSHAQGIKSRKVADLSRWHALHDYICSGATEVHVPFAEALARNMPSSHPRVQRDFPQLLSLIKAHAKLHRLSRSRNGDAVVANLNDYEQVYDLVVRPLSEGLEAAVPAHVRRVVEGVQEVIDRLRREQGLPDDMDVGVSQRDVSEHIRIHASNVSRAAAQAIDQGFLSNDNPGQGKEAKLRLGSRQLPSGYVLPTRNELEAAYSDKPSPLESH